MIAVIKIQVYNQCSIHFTKRNTSANMKKKTFTQGDVQMIFFNDFFFIIVSCADMLLRLVAGGTIIKNAITNKKA